MGAITFSKSTTSVASRLWGCNMYVIAGARGHQQGMPILMIRRALRLTGFLMAFLILALAGTARAEERIALVLGNAGYKAVSPLRNPLSDAALVARTLEGLGFRVTLLTDASRDDMIRGVSQFGRDLRAAGADATGLFYYAGHGVQSFGSNYLLPVDAALNDAADLDLVALEASAILRQMHSARNRTNIFILDACRNNPFETVPGFNENGLAEMDAPTGTFLSYATAPGDVAYDGEGGNSPYSAAIARQMSVEGQSIEHMFRNVRVKVLTETGGLQTPWDTSSLTVEFTFRPAVAPDPELADEQRLWDDVRETEDPLQVMLFLRAYPEGPFAAEAQDLLAALVNGRAQPAAKAAPAPTAPAAAADTDEEALYASAQSAGTAEGYQAYLDVFPDGVFAEFAQMELAALQPKPADAPPLPTAAQDAINFDTVLATGMAEIDGRSIKELLAGSPLFPPIEGLPEAVWKDKSCSGCHQWTREAICDQANVYMADNGARGLDKQHPYGGTFKETLRRWAAGGCG